MELQSRTLFSGSIKSSIGLGLILGQGIGDTIRVSLTDDPVKEIEAAKLILRTLGLRKVVLRLYLVLPVEELKLTLSVLPQRLRSLLETMTLILR